MCIVTMKGNLMVFVPNVKRILQRKSKLGRPNIKEELCTPPKHECIVEDTLQRKILDLKQFLGYIYITCSYNTYKAKKAKEPCHSPYYHHY